MSSLFHPIAVSAPTIRSVAIAALLGATMLASPLTAAHADSTTTAPIQLAQAATPQTPAVSSAATEMKGETVEERITTLHTDLQITPAEEADWKSVAQTMRGNDAAMQKLVAEKSAKDRDTQTAVEDLHTYETFARAHVDGLKSLTASFETLYKSMPDAQKKVADQVFQSFGHGHAAAHS
jgi:periplasmic protein CpxP/Spy